VPYLLAFAAAGLVIIAAELLTRVWIRWRAEYFVWPPGLRLHLQPDPAVLPTLERMARHYVNRDGERGAEPPDARTPFYRVLVVGGSVPEGLYLDQDTTWPGAMQRILATPENLRRLGTRHVHVGCVARSGVGSESLAIILRRVLPRYRRLNAIVIMVGASDVMRWIEAGAPPHPPATVPTHELFRVHPESRYRWTPSGSALNEVVRRLRRQFLKPVDVQRNAGQWMGRARRMRAEALVVHTDTPPPAPMLDHFDRCIRDVFQLARAHADRVIVVRQPWYESRATVAETPHVWNGSVGKPWKEHVTTFYTVSVLSRLMSMLDARMAAIVRETGVEQVETMPVLRPTEEYYYDFVHLTPKGADVVARVAADAVLGRRTAAAHRRDMVAEPSAVPERRARRASAG
jgi:hypothetical protein